MYSRGFVLTLIFALQFYLQRSSATRINNIPIPVNVCNSTIRRSVQLAFGHIVVQHFVPKTSEVMLTMHAKHKEAWLIMEDFLTCVLPYVKRFKLQVETNHGARIPGNTRQYNILLIDGIQALDELDPASLTKNYDFPEHYLVLLIDTDISLLPDLLIKGILSYFFRYKLINVSILFERKPNYVEVFTYLPFMENAPCKRSNVRVVNVYNGTWLNPVATHIFPKKLTNFQNCTLTVAVWDSPPYLSYYPERAGYERLGSFEGEMLVVLAKKLNFSMELVEPPNNEQRGQRLPNGTLTGAMKLLHDRSAHMSLGCFRYTVERCEVLTGALPYYHTWQIFGIRRIGQTYNSLEIFSLPFDLGTWTCLLLSLQLVLFVAYVMNKYANYSPLAHYIVGYPRPCSPLTNVYSLFLGIPVPVPPRTNFARIALALWIILSDIIRSAYQGLLYTLLQRDLYRTPPASIFELIAKGYSLIMSKGTLDTVMVTPIIQKGLIPIIIHNYTYEWRSYQMVEEFNGKMAGVSPQDYLTYYLMNQRKRGSFYILPDRFFAQYITIYFSKHSYLINRFNELLLQLRSQGLIDFWARKYLDDSYYEMNVGEDHDPLDLDDLWGIFAIYLALTSLAIIMFVGEILWYKIKF